MNKVQSWNIITLFLILIFGFTAATLIKPDAEESESENRQLAQMPQPSLETVFNGEFEADYETYLTDQFVARDAWIGLKTLVERLTLRSESKGIYFAEDDYLIEKHGDSFTTDLAQLNVQTIAKFAEMYREQFGEDRMSVMIVPNAVEVLEDRLPAYAVPYDESAYLTQIRGMLPEGVWFDAEAVLKANLDQQLFYRTDHHWTTQAAFLTYRAWAEQMGFAVPQMEDYTVETATTEFEGTIQSKLGIEAQKDTIELYHPVEDVFYSVWINDAAEPDYSMYDYTALNTKSKYNIFFGGNHARVKIKTRAANGRKLLMIKDSYAHCFVPFMLKEYEEITMLDIRYYNQKLSELIEAEGYTDVLFLYNASGFAEDTSLVKLLY